MQNEYNTSSSSVESSYSKLHRYNNQKQPSDSTIFITPEYGHHGYKSLTHHVSESGDVGYFNVKDAYGANPTNNREQNNSAMGWELHPLTQKCEKTGYIGAKDVFNTFTDCALHHKM